MGKIIRQKSEQFLSTPSGWRATEQYPDICAEIEISIHALRVEGDARGFCFPPKPPNFYPRPPGGGRLDNQFRRASA